MKTKMHLLLVLVMCALFFTPLGCASVRSGRAEAEAYAGSMPAGLRGKDRASLIKALGDPDFITSEKGSEYWGYHDRGGWHFNFYYISGGRTRLRDLVVELSGNRVKDIFCVDKGSSFGMNTAPMSAVD